jgi:hypothetical protein
MAVRTVGEILVSAVSLFHFPKPAKEEKYIANPNPLISEVGAGSSGLSEARPPARRPSLTLGIKIRVEVGKGDWGQVSGS